MNSKKVNVFSQIKGYTQLSRKLQTYLASHPNEWEKFQEEFNLTIDRISRDITEFEINNIDKFESLVYRFKKIFEKRYRRYFLHGEYTKWCLEKPFGYSGDFKIISDIYRNQPQTVGFARLWDNYFMQMTSSKATRERKKDFKEIIYDFVKISKQCNIRIMNIASGPTQEIKELFDDNSDGLFENVIFDCYDFDSNAIDYARKLLNNCQNVNFFQKNMIRFALKKDITREVPCRYDLIYSTGLFDYLDESVAVKLIANLRALLKSDGVMLISNCHEKPSNPCAGVMEWITEWHLIYRTKDEFKQIFTDAGFLTKNVKSIHPRSKVMQYVLATQT